MNPDVKDLWTTALRSGDYKQGAGALRRKREDGPDEFCCLGVLCDLAVKAGVKVGEKALVRGAQIAYDDQVSYPPEAVVEWAGLEFNNPRAGEERLGQWNDSMKADFLQIANLIDEHL